MGEWFDCELSAVTFGYAIKLGQVISGVEPDWDFRVVFKHGRFVIQRRLSTNLQIMWWEYAR